MDNKLKVLLLPFDIASKGANTIDALNKIQGIEAKGLFVNKNDKVARSNDAYYFDYVSFKANPFKWVIVYIKKLKKFYELIKWADVLHWVWDSSFFGGLDIRMAKVFKKKGVIEWSGSDIRYPEKLFQINRFASSLYTNDYEYLKIEKKDISFRRQQKFYNIGFVPIVTPEMSLFLRKELFNDVYSTLHRLNVSDFSIPVLDNVRPIIVHSPTKRHAKGTNYLLKAISALKERFDFDFVLIENMSRADTLRCIEKCDIFVDQLLLGSYGMASCEAMSMGKPVVCYIMDAVFESGLPKSCPIVNANIDNVYDKIAWLLESRENRIELGKKSRKYAEDYLDVKQQASNLVQVYKIVLNK